MTDPREPTHARNAVRRLAESERGTTLILVGLAVFVLMGMSVFVLDYGVLWLARRQAQNAADAGALAGAVARAYDEPANPPAANGITRQSVVNAAQANQVFGAAPVVGPADWSCPSFVAGAGPTDCVRVDVSRSGLPTFFAPIFGVGSQSVQATATAQVLAANTTDCLKPWVIEDKFTGPHGPNGLFDPAVDTYVAPSSSAPGTGYSVPNDYGTHVVFHADSSVPSFYFDIVLSCTGGSCLSNAIANCDPSTQTYSIGDPVVAEPGNKVGPTRNGVDGLIAHDPTASWNAATQTVVNSCAPNCGCVPLCGSGVVSPRIIQAGLVSPVEVYYANGGRYTYHLVNILSFFVAGRTGPQGVDVDAYLVGGPGVFKLSGGSVGPSSAFAVMPALVR